MAFLLFNAHPAKVFMGDTGSLALGGFVAGAAYVTQRPLYILIIGIIYAVELVSVAMQVTYFKADSRQTYLQDDADPPSFRIVRVVGDADRGDLHDHHGPGVPGDAAVLM